MDPSSGTSRRRWRSSSDTTALTQCRWPPSSLCAARRSPPPWAVLIVPASNFCFGLPGRPGRRGETHPCDNEHLRPRCGVHAIHFKAENKCMMLADSCLRLAGLNQSAASDLRIKVKRKCSR
mmetsp:Transcript_33203/g.107376  ORF Transcript_33203/g.107376 Transcript_33203/m.107376 type:complete len:122 (-) Transcript_33203:143-508(-)